MKKRIFGFLLALALTLPALTAVPAKAAGTQGFSDVRDGETAMAVECLRLMGALDGYEDGMFRPGAALTRAQFCKMAVFTMNASGELGKYRAVTVYPDVKPSHWAAPYVNLASKGKQIILGFADGSFHPDAEVTVGQGVTILMRMLGYKDGDVSAVWPDGYMAQAQAVGLLDGLDLDPYGALNRGQAARLLLNLLRTDCKEGGKSFGESVAASSQKSVMLVSSSAKGSDGRETAMEIGGSGGQTYEMANKPSNGLLNGRLGTLLLDKSGKVLTFVPDAEGVTRMAVVSEARANRLTVTTGEGYGMESTTKVHYQGKEQTWSEVYSWLRSGTAVTLYLGQGGGVEYVFVGAGATSEQAVVVYAKGSTAEFSTLTGTATGYTIVKNGCPATASDLRPYDVATYSSATNTLRVCDVRLTGIYENCYPNPTTPSKLTLMGHEFDVLDSAHPMLKGLKVGKQITLLLTEDNKVAGVLDAENSQARGNALGIAKSGSVELLCGITVNGTTSSSAAGELVQVSSDQKGKLGLSRLNGGPIGVFDTVNRKVGGRSLAENALVFETTPDGVQAVSLADLERAEIPASQLRYARTNWANKVDIVVLGSRPSITRYVLGRVRAYSDNEKVWVFNPGVDEDEPHIEGVNGRYETKTARRYAYIENQDGTHGPYITSLSLKSGDYIKAELSGDGSRIMDYDTLEKVSKVPNSAWQGENVVNVSGKTYAIPGDIMCYNKANETWITLDQAHAFATVCDLYVEGDTARFLEVDQ